MDHLKNLEALMSALHLYVLEQLDDGAEPSEGLASCIAALGNMQFQCIVNASALEAMREAKSGITRPNIQLDLGKVKA